VSEQPTGIHATQQQNQGTKKDNTIKVLQSTITAPH